MSLPLYTGEVCLHQIILLKNKTKEKASKYEFGSISVPHVFFSASSLAMWFLLLSPPHS